MKRIISNALYTLTVACLFYLVTAMNSPFVLISLEPSYSTSFSPRGKFKPGSGQTELSIPPSSNDPAVPFTPGAGNAKAKLSNNIKNDTILERRSDRRYLTNIGDRWAHLAVSFTTTFNQSYVLLLHFVPALY